jgi:hypothetical protein
MLSVVRLSDCPKLEFIQPHPHFVTRVACGCLNTANHAARAGD